LVIEGAQQYCADTEHVSTMAHHGYKCFLIDSS
jgi:hypothetical protein